MEKVKVTLEISADRLSDLEKFLLKTEKPKKKAEPVPVPEEPAVVAAPPSPGVESNEGLGDGNDAKPESASGSSAVTKSMIRARGVEITKADKQDELRKIFDQFGAKNLSTLKESDYAEAYKLMMEVEV